MPSVYDSLPLREGEPVSEHRREITEDGYPLMGSSPAERAEGRERAARLKQQAMRDHPFGGDGPYCRRMIGPSVSGSPATGLVSMSAECGYGRDTHPVEGSGLEVPPPV